MTWARLQQSNLLLMITKENLKKISLAVVWSTWIQTTKTFRNLLKIFFQKLAKGSNPSFIFEWSSWFRRFFFSINKDKKRIFDKKGKSLFRWIEENWIWNEESARTIRKIWVSAQKPQRLLWASCWKEKRTPKNSKITHNLQIPWFSRCFISAWT